MCFGYSVELLPELLPLLLEPNWLLELLELQSELLVSSRLGIAACVRFLTSTIGSMQHQRDSDGGIIAVAIVPKIRVLAIGCQSDDLGTTTVAVLVPLGDFLRRLGFCSSSLASFSFLSFFSFFEFLLFLFVVFLLSLFLFSFFCVCFVVFVCCLLLFVVVVFSSFLCFVVP